MKKFFDKMFGEKNKQSIENLAILANAISDVGLWTWWDAQLPKVFQLEFNRTQLYFAEPLPGAAPSNQVALRFNNLHSVTVLKDKDFVLHQKWMEDFKADKLEPFGIDHNAFSFDPDVICRYMEEANSTEIIFGTALKNSELSNIPITLGFWAGEVGIVICAEEMKIYTHSGEISLADISDKNKAWWNYWKEYWKRIDTDNPMPYDANCEITIPVDISKL